MQTTLRATTDQRTVHTMDRLVVFWVALWVVLGVATGVTLWRAADLGDTVASSGTSLNTVGEGLRDLSKLPLIPDRPAELGKTVQKSAAEITQRGGEVKSLLRLLGVLLGIAIIGIPVTPIVGVYLPMRLERAREIDQLKRTVAEHPADARLDQWLAERAKASLVYEDYERIVDDARGDRTKALRDLADAELHRLGVPRPRPSPRDA